MNRALIVIVGLALAGCTTQTGAMKLGPDTYRTSASAAPAAGGSSGAQRLALNDAREFCGELKREILVLEISTGPSTADVTFRCLEAGDPELQRPRIERSPDTVIEDRRSR